MTSSLGLWSKLIVMMEGKNSEISGSSNVSAGGCSGSQCAGNPQIRAAATPKSRSPTLYEVLSVA